MMFNRSMQLYFLVILCHSTCAFMDLSEGLPDVEPCPICTKISEKFTEGYLKTAGSNFGGGNTDWEEKKLKGYAKSETRLIEIMENTCARTESQCSTFLEKYEDEIEEWYQSNSPESLKNFYQWLCIDTAKVCCPQGTFGKNCRRCQYGDNGHVCSGNGECDGDGTRLGNGRCECHAQYSGTNCSNCRSGFIKSIDENTEVICTDIDECRSNVFLSPCLLYKCNNTEGAYECYGEPFFLDIRKLSTLILLMITAGVLAYKDMYGLVCLTLGTATVLIVVFAKNLL